MARKSNKKQIKTRSVKEFKAWISGMLEVQPDNWCPDVAQWKIIQDTIMNLKEDLEYDVSDIKKSIPKATLLPSQPTIKQNLPEQNTNSNTLQLLPVNDETPPEFIVIGAEPSAQPTVETVSSRVLASGKKIKTPSDLSGNTYKSGFT